MLVGWYVVGGVMPLYAMPLFATLMGMVITGRMFDLRSGHLRMAIVLLVLLVIWLVFSGLMVNEAGGGLGAVLNYAAGIAILLAACQCVTNIKQIKSAFAIYSSIVAVSLALGILQKTTGSYHPSEAAYEGGISGFEGMNYLFGKNFLPVIAAGMAMSTLSSAVSLKYKRIRLFFLFLGVTGIAISGSRSTQLSAMVIMIIAIVMARQWRSLFTGILVLVPISGIMIFSEKWSVVFNASAEEASGGRFSFWGAALRMIAEHPIFGVGAGNFKLLMPQYLSFAGALNMNGSRALSEGIAVHNVFLGLAAESGILAMILYLYFYIYITYLAYRLSGSSQASVEIRIFSYACLLYMVGFFIDMNFHNYGNDNNVWFFGGLLLAVDKISRRMNQNIEARKSLNKQNIDVVPAG